MDKGAVVRVLKKIKDFVVGKALNPFDPKIFQNISLVALFAWVGLGSDPISSSAYGPAEAFLALGTHTYLAIFVAVGTAVTILIISSSYSQIAELFPSGGGGYLVASKLLSPTLGMISGCALLIDYVLTITLSIASGVEAIYSFLPQEYRGFQLYTALLLVSLLIILNLRGVKESVLVLMPIFLLFAVTHVFLITYAFIDHYTNLPSVAVGIVKDTIITMRDLGFFGFMLLLLTAYSMGAGTYTGLEAVSNGMPILREPKVQTAKKTMKLMAGSLIFMVLGLMTCYLLYEVEYLEGKTLNAVLFESITSGWGVLGYYFTVVTLISEAALLFVAAQTGFVGGPRVLANMALDRWVPTRFASLSDRLVTQNGVLIMGCSALLLMIFTGGKVSFLLVLYSITVFVTFSLSQAGMVKYWWSHREVVKDWSRKLAVNGLGLTLTLFILASMVFVKFNQGGWITLLITLTVVGVVTAIKQHYNHTSNLVKRLDRVLIDSATGEPKIEAVENPDRGVFNPEDKTAVVLVNGFNGIGLYTVSNIFKSFGGTFKNYIFVEVGVIDAGTFRGVEEVRALQSKIRDELQRYVDYMAKMGYHAESIVVSGIDVVEEIMKITPDILKNFPNATFFGGQLILSTTPKTFSRWLHNYTLYALERRFKEQGVAFYMVPIKV